MKNPYFVKILSSIAFYTAILMFVFIAQTVSSQAATRTWDGGGADNNWSTAANWSDDVAPTSADDAVFNSTSTKNAAIDATFTVGTFQINGGYTGTITQAGSVNLTISSSFAQSAGVFQGGSGTMTINGNSSLSGGTFTGGTGLITYSSGTPLFQQSGGTFSSSGDVTFYRIFQTAGTFNAPAGTLTMFADLNTATGGTFNANGGTIVINSCYLVMQPNQILNNLTVNSGYNTIAGTNLRVNGALSLVDGTLNGNPVLTNGAISYAATFDGGSSQLQFSDAAARTVNLPANNFLLGMILDNPNITVSTSGAGASTFTNVVDVKRGVLQQGGAALNFASSTTLTVSGGTFNGSGAALNLIGGNLIISGGTFSGGAGLISSGFGSGINQSGGAFSSLGDVDLTYFTQSGGTFNAPNGLMTISADWTHTAGGTFNGGTGTVKFTGYNTFNCINQITINVNVTETFNNLIIANQFCNQRYISAGDTLIVNNDFRISYGTIAGGRIRPLGTTTIDATNNGYRGSSIVEYVTPNTNFVINNPSSVVNMFPVEMNAANSTLTSSGGGRINFDSMNLINGTINQGAGIWDMSTIYPGYSQSGGTFNGSAAEVFISQGTGNPLLTNGIFNSGTGKVTGSFRITGGTMSIAGDFDTIGFSLEGGTFNAPLGTMSVGQSFSHTLGGTFNARTGTVQTSTAAGTYQAGFDVNASETFNNLRFNGTNNNANHGIGTGDTLIVNGTLNFNGRGANGGSIAANGDVLYTNYGGYQNASTLVKFQDTATRTITFSNDCTSYFQPTLVDNPNITINSGCNDANAFLTWTSLDLRGGTVNAGNARSGFTGSFAQSGGTFNAGNNALNPSTTISGDFTLSGGDFNAAPFTSFGGNYTHTGGGNFNYAAGTAIFSGIGGTIDVNGSENFNNISFQQGSTGTTKTIAAGDTIIANGNVNFLVGYVSGGAIEAKKNVSVGAGNVFSGGSTALNFTGATDQIFTNAGGITTSGTWTVNKPNSLAATENNFAAVAPTNLLISGNIGNNGSATLVPLNVAAGNVIQTGNYNHALASLSVTSAASFVNEFGGVITLGGDVTNNGIIKLNANGTGCQADSILLRSTNATQRTWNGSGYFLMTDVDVSGQSGTPIITVYNGTNSGNNGANWVFNGNCVQPTAAAVSVSGRVLSANGRGIANVAVVLTDKQSASRVAVSNSFGNYIFNEVAAGQTVILAPQARKYKFTGQTQVLNLADNLTGINFTADQK